MGCGCGLQVVGVLKGLKVVLGVSRRLLGVAGGLEGGSRMALVVLGDLGGLWVVSRVTSSLGWLPKISGGRRCLRLYRGLNVAKGGRGWLSGT